MGREVRMVPPDWEHPKNDSGNHIPLFDSNDIYDTLHYMQKYPEDYTDRQLISDLFESRMPFWKQSDRTYYQMYEKTTEGTPISPPMKTPEKLAQWLSDNNASAFGSMTAPYEHWLDLIVNQGSAVSAVATFNSDGYSIKPGFVQEE